MNKFVKTLIEEGRYLIKEIPRVEKLDIKTKTLKEWRYKLWMFMQRCRDFTTGHILQKLMDDLNELVFQSESNTDFKHTKYALEKIVGYFTETIKAHRNLNDEK